MVGTLASERWDDTDSQDSLGRRTLGEADRDLDQPFDRIRERAGEHSEVADAAPAAPSPVTHAEPSSTVPSAHPRDRRCVLLQLRELQAARGAPASELKLIDDALEAHGATCRRSA